MTITEHTLRLDDGRTLSWCELGAPASTRVLVANHGAGSSRLELAFHDSLLEKLGLRVIAPERPGYGLSSALHRGRTMAEWADDIVDVATAASVDELSVLGYSIGGAHALAIAASPRLAGRVDRVVLLAAWAPDQPQTSTFDAEVRRRVDAVPWCEYEQWYRSGLDDILGLLAPADEALFADPDLAAAAGASLAEGARQGALGLAGDDWAAFTPWGFDLASIDAQVDIWHGTADRVVPVAHAHALHELIPSSRLHLLPGDGHFSVTAHLADALADL